MCLGIPGQIVEITDAERKKIALEVADELLAGVGTDPDAQPS